MTQLWLDPTFGASGDMMLGALAGLLPDPTKALTPLNNLGLDNFDVSVTTENRNGLSATRATVTIHQDPNETPHRNWSSIDDLLKSPNVGLPKSVVAGARRTFKRLAEVEADQHGVDVDEVVFHEVGALDAIIDIVGSWLLLDALETASGTLDSITVGPVGLGYGTVTAAHGLLSLPAPATLALLRDHPTQQLDYEAETCTPTGAALLTTMATAVGQLPSGTLGLQSRGAGGRDPKSHPNVLAAVLVNPLLANPLLANPLLANPLLDTTGSTIPDIATQAVLIESNVDDVTPEVLAYVIQQLLSLGVDDAWIVPIVMKKGRPAHEIRVLAKPSLESAVRSLLASETGTLGIRVQTITKHALPRSCDEVTLYGSPVRIKVGPHGAKAEHDDLVAVANKIDLPLRQLASEAIALWQTRSEPNGS